MDAELRRAVAGSVVVHLVLVGILALTLWEHPTISASSRPAAPMQARVVDEATALAPQRQREAEVEKKRQAEQQRKQAEAEKKRQAEQQRKQAEAEKKRQAEQQRKQAEVEKKRQAEEKRKQAEAEKKRQAEEKRKQAEAEKKRQEQEDKAREAALQQQLAAEEARLAEEARQQRLQRSGRVQSQYVADIQNKVERNWLRPPGSRGNVCRVVINQIPGGEITGTRVTDCDGDVAFQRSVEAAVRKASPLPLPQDPGLFQREIEFVFRP